MNRLSRTATLLGLLGLSILATGVSAAPELPGLNCDEANGVVEHLICGDPELTRLDALLTDHLLQKNPRQTLDREWLGPCLPGAGPAVTAI